MADEFPLTRANGARVDLPAAPARPRPRAPDDPEAARAEIEATRARMSETIDEIEDALLRRKEMIKQKLDVLAPVREQPLKMIGIIFGVGLALGLLTGGGDDDDDDDDDDRTSGRDEDFDDDDLEDDDEDEDDGEAEAWAAAEMWEDRAHRLLRVARAQESELEVHRARRPVRMRDRARDDDDDADEDDAEGGDNLFDRLREGAAERLSQLIGEVTERVMRGG